LTKNSYWLRQSEPTLTSPFDDRVLAVLRLVVAAMTIGQQAGEIRARGDLEVGVVVASVKSLTRR
jgi:hypothetical protein